MLFSRWGAFVYRFRRPIAIATIVRAGAAGAVAGGVTGALSAGGWLDPNSESAHVIERLDDEFGAGRAALVALFKGQPGGGARSEAFQADIAASTDRLVADDRVDGVVGYAQTQ